MQETDQKKYTSKDFGTDQEVRWCPGCGDYSILNQVKKILPEIGVDKENIVFISGIGCSSRFPYYTETYGMHSIHGRATAIASGLKAANPGLDVWIVTGDGDALSIGGNHLIHLLRRNINVNILLFNNEIYGLTKGQYSPTSPVGKISASTPQGSLDYPFNPLMLALGAEGTFVARSIDTNPTHLRETLLAAHNHQGSSLVEIYQNCNVFNDGCFSSFSDKDTKEDNILMLTKGDPLIFGKEHNKGIILDGFTPKVADLTNGFSKEDCWIHDPSDRVKAILLTQFFDYDDQTNELPRPFGLIFEKERSSYENQMSEQIEQAIANQGVGNLDDLLAGSNPWTVD
ncbi:MAG: 2-oxoacid:ferredoxin oxidoreductase subunit beta [Reichenbachiella sp.]